MLTHFYDICALRSKEHNFRYQNYFSENCINTSHFELNSFACFTGNVLNMVLPELKILNAVGIFKSLIRKWEPAQCLQCLNSVCHTSKA